MRRSVFVFADRGQFAERSRTDGHRNQDHDLNPAIADGRDQRPTTAIKFGTDGWRAVIADDFTFENVRRVAGAIASYVLKHEDPSSGVIVGYDTRFGSPRFARAAAEVLAGAGIPVKLAEDYVPTPAISLAVKNRGAAGGVVITSSHNPWNWNGVKFKGKFGGSATPAIMKVIEQEIAGGRHAERQTGGESKKSISSPRTFRAICEFADLDLIAKANSSLLSIPCTDPGAASSRKFSVSTGSTLSPFGRKLNPLFPDINPEPIEPHVRMLQETVVREQCHAGFPPMATPTALARWLKTAALWIRTRYFPCCSIGFCDARSGPEKLSAHSTRTRMLDRIAAKHGRKLNECPIGFKHIADLMMEREIVIGGEESGGIGYSRYLPERDGILNSLLLANVLAEEKQAAGRTRGNTCRRNTGRIITAGAICTSPTI